MLHGPQNDTRYIIAIDYLQVQDRDHSKEGRPQFRTGQTSLPRPTLVNANLAGNVAWALIYAIDVLHLFAENVLDETICILMVGVKKRKYRAARPVASCWLRPRQPRSD